MITEATFREAMPIDDDDWGSDRQVDAENELFRLLEQADIPVGEGSRFARWALKATAEERINEAHRLWMKEGGNDVL